MTSNSNNHPAGLEYRLRPAVRYHALSNGKAVLVLGYPLRAVFIPSPWQPIIAALESAPSTPFTRIIRTLPHIPPITIEQFFNTLIRKGYVAQTGFLTLPEKDYSTISIIIPVRNRAEQITDCLASLTSLDYPAEKREIIVVDDASEDHTPDAVTRFPHVRLIRMRRHRQASFCRNRGAEAASGEILAFIDSDCLAAPTWLKELAPAFRDPSMGALGGWVDAAYEEKALDRYEKVKSSLQIGAHFKRTEDAERFFYVPACNFLVRRKAFLQAGGFAESLHVGEDVDLCWRLQDAGQTLEYRPMGRVLHKHRNRIAAFCARRFDYGTSEPMLQRLHTGRVKTLLLPWPASLFWLTMLLCLFLKSPLPLAASTALLFRDVIRKHRKLKEREIPVSRAQVLIAIIRSHLSFVYHCCSFISRYYLIGVPLVSLFSPMTGMILIIIHLIAGMVEYTVRKPKLNPFSFLLFFTLEQLSYQAGVWWACIRQVNFKPVLPRVIHKRI